MERDIAPDFQRLIAKMPAAWLEDMRRNFQNSRCSSHEAVKRVVLDLSIELLRRKWGCKVCWERTGIKV